MTLLHWAHAQGLSHLKAIHVNHQLSDHAQQWQQFCEQQCALIGVPIVCREVTLAEGGLEEAARNARYRVFEAVVSDGDVLLQGHHANDQAETLLFRMLRGTSWRTLSAIPETRPLGVATIYRPWLTEPRASIEQYAAVNKIDYVSDPSNEDSQIDRNYLRHKVLRALVRRWPHAIERLAGLATQAQAQLVAESELTDYWLTEHVERDGYGEFLRLDHLQALGSATRRAVIGQWLHSHSLITSAALQPLYDQCSELVSTQWFATAGQGELFVDQTRLRLQTKQSLQLIKQLPVIDGFDVRAFSEVASVSALRFHPQGRAHSNRVKKLMQEWQVPARYRGFVPVIMADEQLVFIYRYWRADIAADATVANVAWPC